MTGSIISVTNSTIVAIGQHLLTDKRRRYVFASPFLFVLNILAQVPSKCKNFAFLILTAIIKKKNESGIEIGHSLEFDFVVAPPHS